MATIGFIGLGNMGAPMAANLLKAQHRVTGYDVVAAPVAALAEQGGHAAAGIAEAAAAGDIVDHDAAGRAAGARGLSRPRTGSSPRPARARC